MKKTIYLAGGCFWGLQKLLKEIPGVLRTVSGYANGSGEAEADYETVCTGRTGFRETVRADYDTDEVTLDRLLFSFFDVIDLAAVNRQGNDVGTQYQSGVYWEPGDEETARTAARVSGIVRERCEAFAVELKPLKNFFPAEDYHQDYLDRFPGGYCHISPLAIKRIPAEQIDPGRYPRPEEQVIREKLSELQYAVTQKAGTEPPFDNAFWDFDQPGIYVDVVTGEPLFTSKEKFESDCGWPAFSAPVEAGTVTELEDRSFGMARTEVRSRSGNSHLGHVFRGPYEGPDGVRYCINSAALRFVPFDEMEEAGYGWLKNRITEEAE